MSYTSETLKNMFKDVYFDSKVPHNSNFGLVKVTIANSYEAPYFVLGKSFF